MQQPTKYISERIFLFILIFALTLTGSSQFGKKLPPPKPRLIIGIVIDPFSIDQLSRYQDKLSPDGFRRLINQGSFFRNTRYNYFFTEAESGIATLVTGTAPVIHGIVGKNWYEPLHDKRTECTYDEGVYAVGGSYENGAHSPHRLFTSTIGDEMRINTHLKSKVFGVSLSPDNAVLLGGHTANGVYWFDEKTGTWMSSSFYMDSLPEWVKQFNEKDLVRIYLQKSWKPLLPLSEYSASLQDSSLYENGIKGRTVFPYDLKKLSNAGRRNEDISILRITPYGNTLTKDFVTNLIMNENLGRDEYCDFLGIGFSANRYILQAFGSQSAEMEDAILRLDQDISHLLTFIDKETGKENVLIFLTASRGISPGPEYMEKIHMPSGYFNPNQAIALMRSYLNVIYGEGDWIKGYYNHQVYLNHVLIENANLSLYQMQDKVADFLIQFTGVSHVLTSHALRETGASNDLFQRVQNGLFPKRSGDVVVILNPGWLEKSPGHEPIGSGFWYDTHVPLIWYGWKIPRSTWYHPTDLSAVAPTLSFFLQIPVPNGSEGHLINEILDTKNR